MSVAITGATGFAGRHLVAALDARGIPVTILCRSTHTLPVELRRHRVVQCDLTEAPPRVFDELSACDTLVHLAWGGLPNYGSLHHFEHQLPAQFRFLKRAVESGIKYLVITGSCLEYGLQSGELSEAHSPMPTTAYAFAKDTLRRQLEFLRSTHMFSLTWARLFYTYGPGQAATSIYSQLQAAVARGDATFPMSRGEQLRDYLPIEDVADVLAQLAVVKADIGVVNVCSGNPISVRRLVEEWITANQWRIQIRLGEYPYPSYEPLAFWGNRSKLDRALCEYRPQVPS